MVTAFEILARMFSRLGDFQVQAFPAFGVERTGAPIQAFLRVAKKEILNRSNIYQPNLVVIFDESLLEQVAVADGLRPEGAVLINTERPPAAFASLAERVFTVPATRIALELGLGSKSLPIVNAAMIGAAARLFEADPVLLQQIVRENVPAKPEANAKAAQVAYNALQGDLQSRRPAARAAGLAEVDRSGLGSADRRNPDRSDRSAVLVFTPFQEQDRQLAPDDAFLPGTHSAL